MSDLAELLVLVKDAVGPDAIIEDAIALKLEFQTSYTVEDGDLYVRFQSPGGWETVPAYTASIDAALSLVGRKLQGWVVADLSQNSRHAGDPWGCKLACYFGSDPSKNREAASGYDFPTAPLAILAALLSALQSEGGKP